MFKKSVVLGILALAFFCAQSLPGIQASQKQAAQEADRVEKSIQVLKEIVELPKPEEALPGVLFNKAEGLAVFPGVIKAAYSIGGQYGRGIVVIKSETGAWSNPVFVRIIGGSIGWQIGVQKADIVLVFKTRKSIENMAAGKITLGADISVVAGPVGRQAEASTDLEMEAEIYSYSKSKGLFAGVSIKGASIQIDKDADSAFYGRDDVTAREIFYGEAMKAPAVVEQLKAALAKYSGRKK